MKVSGIAGARHPELKKGDAIEFTPEQKVCAMAKEQVVESSPEGLRYIPISAEVVGDVQVIAGREVKGHSDPAQYIATVVVKFRTLKLADDRLRPNKSVKVKIHCKDCKDEIGVPDLQSVDFQILKEL
jgi:hypothetical protein